jgi:hypothetical protein
VKEQKSPTFVDKLMSISQGRYIMIGSQ